jgi:hypothetical protein
MNYSVAIDFQSMEAFVNCMEVELNFASNIINHDLVTINFTYCAAEFKELDAQFFLALLQTMYARL